MKQTSCCIFLIAEDPRPMTVGMARSTVFKEIRSGAGVKTGDFVKEKLGLGGGTVVRFFVV